MKRGPYTGSFCWKLSHFNVEELMKAIMTSFSIRDTCQKLGLELNGSSYPAFRQFCKEKDIDIAHFHGKRVKKFETQIERKERNLRQISQLSFENVPSREKKRLKVLMEQNFQCIQCGTGETWQGKQLSLQLDHIDGNRMNNKRQNLRILCPNCHSQTETWGTKNRKK